MPDYNIILVIIVIVIIIIINTGDKIKDNPLSIIKSKYNEINIKLNKQEIYKKKTKIGSVIIVSHNYEHVDVLIIINELLTNDSSCIIVAAYRPWNMLLSSLYKNSLKKCNIVYITNNTVNKMKSYLEQGYNVIIFYYKYKTATGIFNLIKMSHCDVYTLRISCDKPHIQSIKNYNLVSLYKMFSDSFNNQYHIEYNTFDKPKDTELPDDYMTRLKNYIYYE